MTPRYDQRPCWTSLGRIAFTSTIVVHPVFTMIKHDDLNYKTAQKSPDNGDMLYIECQQNFEQFCVGETCNFIPPTLPLCQMIQSDLWTIDFRDSRGKCSRLIEVLCCHMPGGTATTQNPSGHTFLAKNTHRPFLNTRLQYYRYANLLITQESGIHALTGLNLASV
jgi:hypothetical protein